MSSTKQEMIAAKGRLIFDSPHLQVLYYDAPGDDLLVTFAPFAFPFDGSSFWGARYALAANRPTLGFVSKHKDWFPPDHVAASAEAIQPYLNKFSRKTTYGSSMGGYGALKYGRFLGARVAVAFAPQYSLDPADDVTNPNFTTHFRAEVHAGMCLKAEDLAENNYIFYDPLERFDEKNARFIQSLSTTVIPIPVYAGTHNTIYLVASTERAEKILNACSELRTADVKLLMTRYCRASQTRAAPLIAALSGRHPEWARRLFEKHRKAFSEKPNIPFKKGVWPHTVTAPHANLALPEHARIKKSESSG